MNLILPEYNRQRNQMFNPMIKIGSKMIRILIICSECCIAFFSRNSSMIHITILDPVVNPLQNARGLVPIEPIHIFSTRKRNQSRRISYFFTFYDLSFFLASVSFILLRLSAFTARTNSLQTVDYILKSFIASTKTTIIFSFL